MPWLNETASDVAHTSRDDLCSWLAGTMETDKETWLENHLVHCDVCSELLETLQPDQQSIAIRLREICDAALSTQTTPYNGEPINAVQSQPSRWELTRLLAKGGIGEVWVARDRLLLRNVAVKRLRKETSHSLSVQRRLLSEARITAQIGHRGTAHIFDIIEDGPESYYVMSLIRGSTLREVVLDFHSSPKEHYGDFFPLLRHWLSVARTLAFAHTKRILHRDVKAENIVVSEFGEVTVIDWGLAKRIGERDKDIRDDEYLAANSTDSTRTTEHGERLGTPAFMAPEQASGNAAEVDERTDVYGLAALLYEILAGKPPFAGKTVDDILLSVLHDVPHLPTNVVFNVPVSLKEICLRGLSKRPIDRQQTVHELSREVTEWMTEQLQRRRSEKERDRFFRLSQDLLAIIDANGVVRQCNPSWEQVIGWSHDELVGMTDVDLIHADHMDEIPQIRAQLLASGQPLIGLEKQVRCKDGRFKWLSWNVTPIPDEASLYIVGRDINNQKRLHQRFSGLLETMPDAVLIADIDGKIRLVNGEAERLFSYPRNELIGCHISQVVAERSRSEHLQFIRRLASNRSEWANSSYVKFFGLRKDGSEFLAEIRHSALETDYELLFTGTIRDMSKRLRDEAD